MMETGKGKLGLSMIVKNEAKVIARCLESVKPFISYWVISDTGSTDNTKEIVREVMRGIPGELIERPWVNWGVSRTEPYLLAKAHTEYTLALLDADEVFEVTDPAALERMTADCYLLTRSLGSIEFPRRSILKNSLPWRFEGELHENAEAGGRAHGEQVLKGVRALNHADGHAWADPVAAIERYAREAERFKNEVEQNPGNTRAQFYLAQSYRDSLQKDLALMAYIVRGEMKAGFNEETYLAWVNAGRLAIELGSGAGAIRDLFMRAHSVIPERAEAMYSLGRYYREHVKDYQLAQIYLRQAAATPEPDVKLFHEFGIYKWMAKDELAITLTWCARWEEALGLFQELMSTAPDSEKSRYMLSMQQCMLRLGLIKTPVPVAPQKRLNLGCGNKVMQSYENVDIVGPCDTLHDLATPWPWQDSSVDVIEAVHVFEYIPDMIFVMNEAHRVLKSGGHICVKTIDANAPGMLSVDPMVRSHWSARVSQFFDAKCLQHKTYVHAYGITAKFDVSLIHGNDDGTVSFVGTALK